MQESSTAARRVAPRRISASVSSGRRAPRWSSPTDRQRERFVLLAPLPVAVLQPDFGCLPRQRLVRYESEQILVIDPHVRPPARRRIGSDLDFRQVEPRQPSQLQVLIPGNTRLVGGAVERICTAEILRLPSFPVLRGPFKKRGRPVARAGGRCRGGRLRS